MADKPEALRLANLIDHGNDSSWIEREAAAELRRLHGENERLHQINQSHEMKLSVRGYEIQIEDLRLAHAELRERNAELLEALKLAQSIIGHPEDAHSKLIAAAIAKAEAQP
jgi:hypothetical protein